MLIEIPENGWIQNCNSTPFTAADIYSPEPEDYPEYMASFPENYRGIHAISLLEKAKGLNLDSLIELAYDPYLTEARAKDLGVTLAKFDELIAQSDYITVHMPLTADTKHMINADTIKQMKEGVRIFNCARGGIIDEAALIDGLK